MHKIAPPEHFDDFKQEVFLILTQKQDDVLRAYNDNKHLFYAIRIMVNLATQERNVYHKTYRNRNLPFREDIFEESSIFKQQKTRELEKLVFVLPDSYKVQCDESDELSIRKIKEEEEIKLLDRIEGLEEKTGTCYYRLLVAAIKKHGTYREVSRQTGIPLTSIHNAVKKIRKIISDD